MAGFADDSSGFDVVYADNIDFSGSLNPSASITTNGQLLIGSTALPHIQTGKITTTSLSIGYSNPNITINTLGGGAPIEKINVDTTTGAGTNPVLPNVGAITMTGGQYATGAFGTRVITINSTAANTLAVEAQISSTNASSLSTLNGLCHFNSGDFSVDANGFVTIIGGGFKWNDQTVDLNPIVKENGYFADKGSRLVLTLPTTAVMGDTFAISGFGANGWQVNAGAGQIIKIGSQTTAVAGNLQSTNALDQVEIVCSPTTTTFIVRHVLGNITVN